MMIKDALIPERFMPKHYRQCSLSVMDNISDPGISFNEQGISNYFDIYKQAEKEQTLTGEAAMAKVEALVDTMKRNGKGKAYDCILGVSGGVDSTFLALKAKELGLRVLCVHFDNGWNSELAVKNIENIISNLGFDLFTYVINWEEFRDIQLAYFRAHVIDIEAVTDIAIFSALDKICSKKKLKYILDGRNVWTEEVLPKAWIFKDPENLVDIHAKFGSMPLKSYPLLNRIRRAYIQMHRPVESVKLLNYMFYDKQQAKEAIVRELQWRDYGGKHYESVFTRFYQGYILPLKFGVDKRKAHLSNLIFAGQMTKQEAIEELKEPIYPLDLLTQDKEFVMKKLGFSPEEFDSYLNAPGIDHRLYKTTQPLTEYYPLLKFLKPFYQTFKKIK